MSTTLPLPGYTTTKALMPPIRLMMTELGAQDACIQLQELSIEYLCNSAIATKAPIGDFLKLLYKGNNIPHGTHDFDELRELSTKSHLVVTYAVLEKMIQGIISAYKAANPAAALVWKVKNAAGEKLPPFLELLANLPISDTRLLESKPEHSLFEYYRAVRVANSHIKGQTLNKANAAYAGLSANDHSHFRQCYGLDAPNAPDKITFDDFLLFTRAIKYYSKLLNEACC